MDRHAGRNSDLDLIHLPLQNNVSPPMNSEDDGYAQSTMAPLPIPCEHVLWLDPLNLIETRAPTLYSGQFDVKSIEN